MSQSSPLLKLMLSLVAAAPLTLTGFYAGVGHAARAEVRARGLDSPHSNGIKHAYAAAESIMQAWRGLGMGRRRSAEATEWLGHVNEWMEHCIKASRNDEAFMSYLMRDWSRGQKPVVP